MFGSGRDPGGAGLSISGTVASVKRGTLVPVESGSYDDRETPSVLPVPPPSPSSERQTEAPREIVFRFSLGSNLIKTI